MKVYRVYTDDGMSDAFVGENVYDEFWEMVNNNSWVAEEISK